MAKRDPLLAEALRRVPISSSGLFGVREAALLLDIDRNDVAGLQVHLFLWRFAGHDTFRRPGQNNVAGHERHMVRNVADDLVAAENHVRRVGMLAHSGETRALNFSLCHFVFNRSTFYFELVYVLLFLIPLHLDHRFLYMKRALVLYELSFLIYLTFLFLYKFHI